MTGPTVAASMKASSEDPKPDTSVYYIHHLFQVADTATEWSDIPGAFASLNEIMGECNRLVHTVSELEKAHRQFSDQVPYHYDPGEYTDVMGFIAGVGSACAGVALRLGSVNRAKETGRFQSENQQQIYPGWFACLDREKFTITTMLDFLAVFYILQDR